VTIFSRPETILHILTSGIAFTFVFNIIFVSSFMDSRTKYPNLYRILDLFLVFAVINTVLYFYDYYWGNAFAMIYGPILGWILAIFIGLMWYWGESHARYLFLAHILLPILGMAYVGMMSGLIQFNFALAQSFRFAYLFQGMFFALALADRYSMMQRNFQCMLEDQAAQRSEELIMANQSLRREINERKRVEEAIEKAKNEWEQTFDTVPDLIAIIDQNYKIVRINKAMAERLNAHPKDAVGCNCYELCHGTNEPIPACPLLQSLRDGNEHSAEILENRLGGAFLVSVTPLPNEHPDTKMFVHVARDITERKAFEKRLSRLALTDSLTKIWNRRHFVYLAGHELERIKRYGGSLAIMMIDLDHFKVVNDTYGHEVGDQALKKVAETVWTVLRKVDIFARIGGEEFVIALPETGLEQAVHVAERIRESLAVTPLANGRPPLRITVSIGITVTGQSPPELTTLLKQADTALYNAKRKGRNRVEVFVEPGSA
jgi:diguanylate cyclase (GGDEF)-like protein/PAS domain S-box-containing protein